MIIMNKLMYINKSCTVFFPELVLVILLWELVSLFVFCEIQTRSLYQIGLVPKVVVLHL